MKEPTNSAPSNRHFVNVHSSSEDSRRSAEVKLHFSKCVRTAVSCDSLPRTNFAPETVQSLSALRTMLASEKSLPIDVCSNEKPASSAWRKVHALSSADSFT